MTLQEHGANYHKRYRKYIQDICDDIWDSFKDAKIEGYIYDTDAREDVVEFKSDSKQKLKFDFVGNTDISDLEDELNYDYKIISRHSPIC